MLGLGTKELVIIAIIFIFLFGTKKIPELAKSLVDAIKHIRSAFKNLDDDKNLIDPKKK